MAKAISPTAGQRCGIQRVCRLWDVPRSSFYAAQVKSAVLAAPPARRGPKPAISDEALLAAIKRELETSPWTGHRRAIRTINLLERLFGEERRRTKVIPHAFSERAALKADVCCAHPRCRAVPRARDEQVRAPSAESNP
jgi:hypothetical protein